MYRTTGATASNHLSPTHDNRNHETERLMSGSYNHSEMSGEPATSISELSPNAERSAINTPRRAAVPAFDDVDAAQVQGTDLYQSEPSATDGPRRSHAKHIMSWMDYDGAMPGPAR